MTGLLFFALSQFLSGLAKSLCSTYVHYCVSCRIHLIFQSRRLVAASLYVMSNYIMTLNILLSNDCIKGLYQYNVLLQIVLHT